MAALAEIDLTTRRSRSRPDFLLILAAAALSAAGLVMIYTITAPRLEAAGVDPSGDMVRQAFFMAGGAVVFIAASFIGPRQWKELAPYAYVAALVLLLLVLTPVGASRQGAQRWIPLGPIDLQPAEFAKPAMILALAALLSASEEARVGWARLGRPWRWWRCPRFSSSCSPTSAPCSCSRSWRWSCCSPAGRTCVSWPCCWWGR